jgi:hypothetical protein
MSQPRVSRAALPIGLAEPVWPDPAPAPTLPVPLLLPKATDAADAADTAESDQVFASAADLFRLLATPLRLRIISALCGHEKTSRNCWLRSIPPSPI